MAVSLWLISPRFAIKGPSLIDDWSAIAASPHQVSSVGRLFSVYDTRFRPGWIVWNYLQWHTLGAPLQMLGPNLWDVLRLAVFGVGVSGLTVVLLGLRQAHGSLMLAAAAAFVAPLLVLTTPNVATDFARFGPQEPLLVGLLALGGSLLILGGRALATRPWPAGVLLTLGSAVWIAGVYQKETSVCVLVLLPFLYLAHRAQVGEVLRRLDRRGRFVAGAATAAVILPIGHVAVEVVLITRRGPLVYGAQPTYGGGAVHKTYEFLSKMQTSTNSYVGWLLLAGLCVPVATGVVRRRPDWLLSGLLATSAVCLVWNAQTGEAATRYYIPSLALSAVGCAIALAELRGRSAKTMLVVVVVLVAAAGDQLRIWSSRPGLLLSHEAILAAVVAAVLVTVALARRGARPEAVAALALLVLIAGSARIAHRSVLAWAQDDEHGWQLVQAVSDARESGCPVVISDLDPERTAAVPIVSALHLSARSNATCNGRAYFVVGPAGGSATLAATCAPRTQESAGGWVLQGEHVRLLRCETASTPTARRILGKQRIR